MESKTKLNKASKIKIHVVSMIKSIDKLKNEGKTPDEISIYSRSTFNQLHTMYPSLYLMILDKGDSFEMRRLDEMFNMISSIDNKRLSHQQASEQIGRTYFDEYVKPLVNEEIETDKN